MRRLLDWYNTEEKTLKTISVFHACYERIHPFQDGNGRTGRMILFKESLKNGIVPAIVNEEDRNIYMQSLHLAQTEKDYEELVDFLKKKQADYYKDIRDFLWEYLKNESKYKRCTEPGNPALRGAVYVSGGAGGRKDLRDYEPGKKSDRRIWDGAGENSGCDFFQSGGH